jgi:pyrroloquinoline quinone (PQQ) biosynthesis protein C
MPSTELPLLRADARLNIVGQTLEVEIEDTVFTLSGAPPSRLQQAMGALNGLTDLERAGRQSGVAADTLSAIVARLTELGALQRSHLAADSVIAPQVFSAACRRLYAHWKPRLFSHPLWRGLTDGSLPRPVFIGWVIESWFFIENVMDRLPMAIAHTDDRAIRAVFSKHFAEEWDHYTFFERSLDALDIGPALRAELQPLPSTRAIQNLMRAAARRDCLRYAACSGFLESTGRDRQAAHLFFDQVGQFYDGEQRAAVQPMADHVLLDEDYGHGEFVEKVVRLTGPLPVGRALAALQDAYALVETLEMWSDDILKFYQSGNAFPLQALCSYRGLA